MFQYLAQECFDASTEAATDLVIGDLLYHPYFDLLRKSVFSRFSYQKRAQEDKGDKVCVSEGAATFFFIIP